MVNTFLPALFLFLCQLNIPNAINIPNESIGSEELPDLPDKDQLILVYCRSGNRSRQAAEKLAALDYTNIVEFGGINDWPGKTVSGMTKNSRWDFAQKCDVVTENGLEVVYTKTIKYNNRRTYICLLSM